MFDSERNKQHQSVLCKEIRRLPKETIEQLAVSMEKLVRVLTRNLTQEDTQTPSHFVKEEIIETIVTTTQQSIFHQYI